MSKAEDRRDHRRRPGRSCRRRPCAGARACRRSCWKPARHRPRRAAMGPRPVVLAMGIQYRPRRGAAARINGLEFARARRSIRPARNWWSAISSRWRPRPRSRPHPHLEPRHRHQPRRLRQAQDQGPRSRAVRDPLSERARPQSHQGRRRDRRLRHLAFAKSGRRQWPARHRRDAGGGQDRLRHAGCAGKRPRALCRQDRRRARRRTFGDRHADRSRAARGGSAGDTAGLAAARQRSRKSFWRRRQ